jgi:hypothetical protein
MYLADMAKTNAERQREYRARRDADQARRETYLLTERAAWNRKKEQKKWKPMNELSERDKRRRRHYNRNAQKRYRERQARLRAVETPPETPMTAETPKMSR